MGTRMDRFIGAGLFLFGLFMYFWIIPNYVDIPAFDMPELPADLYPKIIVGAITALGLILFLQGVLGSNKDVQEKMPLENKKRAAIILAVLVGFLFAIDLVGYYLAAAAFLVFMISFLGEKRVWVILLSVIIFLVVNYLFFEHGLKLTLPRGLLFGFLA